MSVKILTKEKLNANAYNGIVIREHDNNFSIKVNGEKLDDKFISISYKLSDNFKKMSDSDKIISIVDSFLAHTQIHNIETSALCAGYSGQFIKIEGTRTLYLQINNFELLKTIIKMIKVKYDRDRFEYCDTNSMNSVYSIVLNKNTTSYGRQVVSCDNCDYHGDCEGFIDVCPNYIQFKVMYANGKMTSFDRKFIERFIYDKLCEAGFKASIVENTEDIMLGGVTKIGVAVKGYCIICGNLEIIFNCSAFSRPYVSDFCNNIINRYNSELNERENVKKRQLKMEGF